MDAPLDKGPPAQFDKKAHRSPKGGTTYSYHLKFPESNEYQIVARCQEAEAVKVACKEPEDAIVMGDSPNYSVEWLNYSIVAEVVNKDEIDKFMGGLETVMKPICSDLQSMRRWICMLCCILCLTLFIIGICILLVIEKDIRLKKVAEINEKVQQYCHVNRATFYARGIRPRPGTTGCYVVFKPNYD